MWTAAFECLGRLFQRKRHSLGNVFYVDRLYSCDSASKHWKDRKPAEQRDDGS